MKINIKNIRVKRICATLFISLFLSCNNGIEELEKRNQFLSSLANLGNDFLSVFTSFGDSLGGVLGFKEGSKKSDVANYFNKIQDTVQGTKDKLNTIVDNMKAQGNLNATAVESAVKTLIDNTLNNIIEGAKTASDAVGTDDKPLGDVADTNGGSKGESVDSLVKGIKDIVEVVLGVKEGNPDAGDAKTSVDESNGNAGALRATAAAGAGKLFGSDSAGAPGDAAKAAKDASKAVGAVTGADILQAIAKGVSGKAAELAKNASVNSNVAAADGAKDAEVAGAIAIRAMTKNGKFSGPTGGAKADVSAAVKGAAISAVTKALDILTIAIRRTIDEGLKAVKDAMKLNAETTPVISETGNATK
ncbi:variable large family protein (plasmid) [Borrelia coriaceae]|uniref:Variable large protein n=1 Tax=Borrelia coriaceae ATCC 43381 TaxID=1408429 RepID=W5SWE9_9SPIR|nr:variable large family protein [Borrelia coriaceae]AHH11255.1 Variable outer membrane protein [Borrelia coriaceae ATCC 43381]UPA17437.1 variable large family protein [Borrelia coriaceae]